MRGICNLRLRRNWSLAGLVIPFVRAFQGGVIILLPLSLSLCLAALGASQPWSKDFAQWTPADIDKVLTASPWAQQAFATFGKVLEPDDMPIVPPPGAEGNMAGSRGVSDGHWDGGVSRNTGLGETPTLPVTVRWDSALPVREALTRSSKDAPVSARAAKDYIITVIGLASASAHKASPPDANPSDGVEREPQDPAEIARAFVTNSSLLPRGKPGIMAEDATYDPATGAVHLFFPRSEAITVGEKEVTFVTRFGSLNVRKKFRLKEMTYKGQLQL